MIAHKSGSPTYDAFLFEITRDTDGRREIRPEVCRMNSKTFANTRWPTPAKAGWPSEQPWRRLPVPSGAGRRVRPELINASRCISAII